MKYVVSLLITNLILLAAILYFVYTTNHELSQVTNKVEGIKTQLQVLELIDANP